MFKNCGPSSCAFLTKGTNLSKGNLEYQRPFWGTFKISKLNFLKTELDYNSSEISRAEWYAYFNWHFKASKHYQKPKTASLQNKILRLTEANKWLKKDKMAPEVSGSSSWLRLRLHLWHRLSLPWLLVARLCLQHHFNHSFYTASASSLPSIPSYKFSPGTYPLSETLPAPFSSQLVRTCPLKIKPSGLPWWHSG